MGDFFLSKWGGKLVLLGNLEKKRRHQYDIKEDFLRELIEIWVDFNFRESFLSKHDFCSNCITWNTSSVRIANRPFFISIGQKLVYKISKILLTMILRS